LGTNDSKGGYYKNHDLVGALTTGKMGVLKVSSKTKFKDVKKGHTRKGRGKGGKNVQSQWGGNAFVQYTE